MPIDGEPAELVERIEAFDAWCAANIAALETVACGAAGHHAPEDQPGAVAMAVSAWADRNGLR